MFKKVKNEQNEINVLFLFISENIKLTTQF